MFLRILKSSCHELHIAHGLILMTPSSRGWEAFPTLRALTHFRITWAFSPSAPQVPGVTPGPLCAHGVSSIPLERCVTLLFSCLIPTLPHPYLLHPTFGFSSRSLVPQFTQPSSSHLGPMTWEILHLVEHCIQLLLPCL